LRARVRFMVSVQPQSAGNARAASMLRIRQADQCDFSDT